MVRSEAKILALMAIYGSLAVALSFIHIPFPPFGDVTPASAPISIISIAAPSIVGVGAALIKGIGISIWTGKWFVEIPVGIGDGLMAAFTYYLAKKKVKPTYAVIAGQLSRYLFTSGMVALYISIIVSTGIPSPLGGDIVAKFNNYAGIVGANPTYHPFLFCMTVVWLARVPSMTLSIILNSFLAVFIVRSAGKQLKRMVRYFSNENEEIQFEKLMPG